MEEIYIDLRKYGLADYLKADFISIKELLERYEDALGDIHLLEEQIEDMKTEYEPDQYDMWRERQMEENNE